jgi:hypothetical protein
MAKKDIHLDFIVTLAKHTMLKNVAPAADLFIEYPSQGNGNY